VAHRVRDPSGNRTPRFLRLDPFTDDRLKLEQLHLRLRKFFSARTMLLDPHQPQSLFQYPNPQLRVL
jgi:hypothetical protein